VTTQGFGLVIGFTDLFNTLLVTSKKVGKQVPETTDTNATMVQQQRKGVLYVVCVEKIYA
jgi:hypothetical protein